MSLTILLFMLIGIVQLINGEDICSELQVGSVCEKSDTNFALYLTKGGTKCCKEPKPIHCAFQPPSKVTDDCKCLPKTTDPDLGELVSDCYWKRYRHLSTNYGTSVPCLPEAVDKVCTVFDLRVNPRIAACHHYPPRASLFESQDGKYCEFMSKGELLPDEMIYDVYFTCWLYDCGNRLEKTNKTLARELKWCYPPVLPGNGVKFCRLYVHDDTTDIYKATPFTATIVPTDTSSSKFRNPLNINETYSLGKGCVLPPICNENGIVDESKYMLPWNGGKADKSHCERLCSRVGPNNGKSSQEADVAGSEENRCRMLPTCGNEENYNRFQVSDYATNCRDWCTPNSTHYLAKDTKNADCNAKPVCKVVDGAYVNGTDKPFSVNNPYGADDCDTPGTCEEGQTEDTHHCTGKTSVDKNKDSFPILPVSLGIGAVVLVAIAGLVVYFVFFRKKKGSGEPSKSVDPEKDVA